MLFEAGSQASRDFFELLLVTATDGTTHWRLDVSYSETSISTGETEYDLGDVAPYQGQWTDFVINYRWNPCTNGGGCDFVALGVSGAASGSYSGNVGKFRVCMSDPLDTPDAEGDRELDLVIDLNGTGVGLVPATGQVLRLRTPKHYLWSYIAEPSSTNGIVSLAWDEYRWGEVTADSTGFADVHMTGESAAICSGF